MINIRKVFKIALLKYLALIMPLTIFIDISYSAELGIQNNLRAPIGQQTIARVKETASMATKEKKVKVMVVDDVSDLLKLTVDTLRCDEISDIYEATSMEQGLEILKQHPDIDFLVLDFRLAGYPDIPDDNGVEFCRIAFSPEYNFKGNVVIYSAEDESVKSELKRYPDLWERFTKGHGQISIQLKHGMNAFEVIKGKIVKHAKGQDTEQDVDIDKLAADIPLVKLDINAADLGVSEETVNKFKGYHVIVADDKAFIRDAVESTVSGLFENIHKTGSVDEILELVKTLRSQGIPDEEIIILSDFEFGTEQTGKRAKDGRDLINIARLLSDFKNDEYHDGGIGFKGHLFIISGSIISKDQIPGFDKHLKDISSDVKEAYGIDYIEKNANISENFPIQLLKLIYSRLENPYDLQKIASNPLVRRPMSKPADISYLNGGVNDFEARMNLGFGALDNVLARAGEEVKDQVSYDWIKERLMKIEGFINFGAVNAGLPFNARVHDYKNRIFYVTSYIIPEIKKAIGNLPGAEQKIYEDFLKYLDNLNMTMSVAQNYMLRLLRLSSFAGNVTREISLDEFMDATVHAFTRDFEKDVEIIVELQEKEMAQVELPYGLTFVVSYLLDNALDQYRIKMGKDFKGKVYFKLNKDTKSIEISVRDEAGGIPEEILPRIFQRSFTTKPHGSGYGLYWAKRVMSKFGGSIGAVNTGNGAQFDISLPLNWKIVAENKKEAPEELVERVETILRKRGKPKPEELSEIIAGEIYDYSSKIAEITKTRETISYNEGYEGISLNIEAMLAKYFELVCTGSGEMFRDIVFEKDTTQKDIENLLLSIIALEKVKEEGDLAFRYLPDRQAIVLSYDEYSGAKILLRSSMNLAQESKGITPELRLEYQRKLRQLQYSMHKLGNQVSVFGLNISRLKKRAIPDILLNEIYEKFMAEWPKEVFSSIGRYTGSMSPSPFEDNILMIERLEGWVGGIYDLIGACLNVEKSLEGAVRAYHVENDEREKEVMAIIHRAAYDMKNTLALLKRNKVEQKYYIDITDFLTQSYTVGIHKSDFVLNSDPDTRVWSNDFFLYNILLNIWRSKTQGKALIVSVKEELGYTVFNIDYEGQVDVENVFETKRTKTEPWQNGPLIMDLVEAAGATIKVENAGQKVLITLKFPKPDSDSRFLEPALLGAANQSL